MKAMIFAAGLGTRLRPLTDTIPKALVEVGGKTLLEHTVERLKRAGFREIVINIHHFADMIRDYVCSHDFFGAEISFSDESDFLRDTGGGIRHAAGLLNDGEPFLVHNVDILSNLEIGQMAESFNHDTLQADRGGKRPLATLLVSGRQTQRYLLFNSEGHLVGWMNIKSGEVRSPFAWLGRTPDTDVESCNSFDYKAYIAQRGLKMYAFDGVHIISPEIFRLMADKPERFSIIDFYLSYCDRWIITPYLQPGLKVVDVGKIGSLQRAGELLADVSL